MSSNGHRAAFSDYALYRYFDSADQLLYVGKSGNLGARDHGHISRSRWMRFAARSAIERYGTPEELGEAERLAIETEHPLFNTGHNHTRDAAERVRAYLEEAGMPDLMPARLSMILASPGETAFRLAEIDRWKQNHTAERDRLVRALFATGVNKLQIASRMEISRTTVYAILSATPERER